jgi:hypothetical protein
MTPFLSSVRKFWVVRPFDTTFAFVFFSLMRRGSHNARMINATFGFEMQRFTTREQID